MITKKIVTFLKEHFRVFIAISLQFVTVAWSTSNELTLVMDNHKWISLGTKLGNQCIHMPSSRHQHKQPQAIACMTRDNNLETEYYHNISILQHDVIKHIDALNCFENKLEFVMHIIIRQ